MINLIRFKSDANGTFGRLIDEKGNKLCYTVELPWKDNQHDISCIPTDTYNVVQYNSNEHGDVWKIMDVPNRNNVEIHPANDVADLLGCIGVGDSLGVVNNFPAVLHSKKTFSMLKSTLPDNFELTISESITST